MENKPEEQQEPKPIPKPRKALRKRRKGKPKIRTSVNGNQYHERTRSAYPNNTSVLLSDEVYYRLIKYAEDNKISSGQILRTCLESIPFDDDTVTPVILSVPNALIKKPEELKAWLLQTLLELAGELPEALD